MNLQQKYERAKMMVLRTGKPHIYRHEDGWYQEGHTDYYASFAHWARNNLYGCFRER